jgi:arylsulfatase A-like enzyme
MKRNDPLSAVLVAACISSVGMAANTEASATRPAEIQPPNIVYLMLDEWGYFESGHMGNTDLLTPNIDRFAKEGMRFTNAYAGAPVCGPTRCSLLTGLHAGHMSMRKNDGFSAIRAEEPTLASMLKQRGYVTGGFGKWGIGGRGTSGVPEKHGFDLFFGYYDQVHAHTFYPHYLIRNSEEVPLPGNPGISFYEGGLKVPYLVRWPDGIKPASVSDHLLYYPDLMPTLAELAGAECPPTDGLSFAPALLGQGAQAKHLYMYWEYQKQTAVRMDHWKAYRSRKGDWELYDLSSDIEEKQNIAAAHPDIVKQLAAHAEAAHQPVQPGEIYDRDLTDKDHRQAPHERNLEYLKSTAP